ncbi:hypothetical protein RQP46_006751 [Phenoliferia psychrophenolica]
MPITTDPSVIAVYSPYRTKVLAVEYFSNFRDDHLLVKATVVTLTVLAVLNAIFDGTWSYSTLVTYYGDYTAMIKMPWQLSAELVILGTIPLVEQSNWIVQPRRNRLPGVVIHGTFNSILRDIVLRCVETNLVCDKVIANVYVISAIASLTAREQQRNLSNLNHSSDVNNPTHNKHGATSGIRVNISCVFFKLRANRT